MAHPFLGVLLHWCGGLAAASFYVPYRAVRGWAWETYWLAGGFFAWIVCPWAFALLLTRDPTGAIATQSAAVLGWTFAFGVLWGIGGITFGLTMRYLGISLGSGVALGLCAAFGTLVPPLAKSVFPRIPVAQTIEQVAATTPGRITLAGVAVCVFGIVLAAFAGFAREHSARAKSSNPENFQFFRGFIVALVCGLMSACFAFGLTAGNAIGEASVAAGTPPLWAGLPKLCVVLFGGFATNAAWCLALGARNRTLGQYWTAPESKADSAGESAPSTPTRTGNYLLCAAAGVTWYLQFFFYTMGETQMGRFSFASWTLHMASIVIFAGVWGWILGEWLGASRRARWFMATSIGILVLSTLIIGFGSYKAATVGT